MKKKEIKLAIINSGLINENGWVCTGTESSDFSDELEILVNNIQSLLTQQHTKDIEKFREIIGEKENVTVVKKSPETEFLLNEIPASQGRNDFRHQLLLELNKL